MRDGPVLCAPLPPRRAGGLFWRDFMSCLQSGHRVLRASRPARSRSGAGAIGGRSKRWRVRAVSARLDFVDMMLATGEPIGENGSSDRECGSGARRMSRAVNLGVFWVWILETELRKPLNLRFWLPELDLNHNPAINRCMQVPDRTARRGPAVFAGWCSSAAQCCPLRSELRSRGGSPASCE